MLESFWLLLAAKMAATALIVVVASLIVERTSPFIGAMVATLPVSAGPAYVFLAMEHGPAFIEQASLTSLAINAVTFVFCAIYAFLAQQRSLPVALGLSLLFWLAAAFAVVHAQWTFAAGVALNVVLFVAAFAFTGAYRAVHLPRIPQRRWWDVPFRAGVVVLLVGSVVAIGRYVGASASGVAALFPIVMTSLAIILQPRIGGPGAAAVLTNALPGLANFGFAVAALHVTATRLGSTLALLLALSVSAGCNGALAMYRLKRAGLKAA
ncbi:MAG: hypothetical protein U1E28_11065 [Beijerinckiaceae bacterium]